MSNDRKAFELARGKGFDYETKPDAWGRPIYKHEHMESMFAGWMLALATHAGAAAAEPSDAEVADFVERTVGLWREYDRADVLKLTKAALTGAPAVPEAKDPVDLYEGWAVFNALSDKAKTRTSPENVSDTLDAVVRLIRSRAAWRKIIVDTFVN